MHSDKAFQEETVKIRYLNAISADILAQLPTIDQFMFSAGLSSNFVIFELGDAPRPDGQLAQIVDQYHCWHSDHERQGDESESLRGHNLLSVHFVDVVNFLRCSTVDGLYFLLHVFLLACYVAYNI